MALATILDGAKELLLDSVGAIHAAGIRDYVVIGGWCPYLRNTSSLKHPGTLDVDILFKEGYQAGALKDAIASLRGKGFIASAKHSFQLLRTTVVNQEKLIYNVDLLHPRMHEEDRGLFIDHLELDIPLDVEGRRLKAVTSIAQPCSVVIFEEQLYSPYEIDGFRFNLVDFTGMFITKMDSCQKVKRERDALDLYIALKSNGIDFSMLKKLGSRSERIQKSLAALLHYLGAKSETFDQNVSLFAKTTQSPAHELATALRVSI
jgi:hypothetical protein